MTELQLKEIIESTFAKHTQTIWITPYYHRIMIPSEEIGKLKEELFNSLKDLNKRRAKNG